MANQATRATRRAAQRPAGAIDVAGRPGDEAEAASARADRVEPEAGAPRALATEGPVGPLLDVATAAPEVGVGAQSGEGGSRVPGNGEAILPVVLPYERETAIPATRHNGVVVGPPSEVQPPHGV